MGEKLFTQAEVNEIVSSRVAKEKEKFDARMAEKDREWNERLQQAVSEANAGKIQYLQEKRSAALLAALEKGRAVCPKEIAKLLDGNVKIDRDNGSIYYEGLDGKRLTVDDGVTEYLKANEWAVKNVSTGGAGSGAPRHNLIETSDAQLRQAMGLKIHE